MAVVRALDVERLDAYEEESLQGVNTCAAVGSQNEAWPVPIRPAFAVEVVASAATITTPHRAFNPFLATDAATPSSLPPLTGLTFVAAWPAASPEGVLRRGHDPSNEGTSPVRRRTMPLRMSTAVSATPRAGVLDPDEQRVIEEARVRRLQRLARREL